MNRFVIFLLILSGSLPCAFAQKEKSDRVLHKLDVEDFHSELPYLKNVESTFLDNDKLIELNDSTLLGNWKSTYLVTTGFMASYKTVPYEFEGEVIISNFSKSPEGRYLLTNQHFRGTFPVNPSDPKSIDIMIGGKMMTCKVLETNMNVMVCSWTWYKDMFEILFRDDAL